jgi:dynein heavy chain, axonemal
MKFPRFYFISDDDLLTILGSSDQVSVQTHLIKLFDNCKQLQYEGNKITAMMSEEGEEYTFKEPFKPESNVEDWMQQVDKAMQSTLKHITKEGVFNYAKMDRTQWIEKYLGMVVIVGC